jgi:hypothetical protein
VDRSRNRSAPSVALHHVARLVRAQCEGRDQLLSQKCPLLFIHAVAADTASCGCTSLCIARKNSARSRVQNSRLPSRQGACRAREINFPYSIICPSFNMGSKDHAANIPTSLTRRRSPRMTGTASHHREAAGRRRRRRHRSRHRHRRHHRPSHRLRLHSPRASRSGTRETWHMVEGIKKQKGKEWNTHPPPPPP